MVSAGLVGFALYKQHVDFIDPCPLCVLQRVAYLWIGAVSLLAAIHGPRSLGRWIYGTGVVVGSLLGAGVAARHLYLQNLPPDQVPECGMGLNYMLDTMPFSEVLEQVFRGSGECAEILWSFLGLTMPGWNLLWYCGFAVVTIIVLAKANTKRF